MLFAVLMQLVMQPMSVHASIQSASGKNAVPEVSYHGKEQSITFKNTDVTLSNMVNKSCNQYNFG